MTNNKALKISGLFLLLIVFTFTSCTNVNQTENQSESPSIITNIKDNEEEIQKLIQEVFIWSDTTNSIILVPLLGDSLNKPIGFDFAQVDNNIKSFNNSNYFSKEFADNYKQIIMTLDRKIKNKEYDDTEWYINELPLFSFSNGWNPWCCCQGECANVPFNIEITKIENEKASLKIKREQGSSWIDFKVELRKEKGIWKISYLQGFDYELGIKKQ